MLKHPPPSDVSISQREGNYCLLGQISIFELLISNLLKNKCFHNTLLIRAYALFREKHCQKSTVNGRPRIG